jgi:hypothetical protein
MSQELTHRLLLEAQMPLTLTRHEIPLRLALSIVAGGLMVWIAASSDVHARLRPTLLVYLAAAVAMVQTNLIGDADC